MFTAPGTLMSVQPWSAYRNLLGYGQRSLSWSLTQRSCRGARPTRCKQAGSAPILSACSDDQQATLAGEADLRFGAAVELGISDYQPE